MNAPQPKKQFTCELCSQSFNDRQGLKVHCTKNEHRRKQIAAECATEAQRELAVNAHSTSLAREAQDLGPSHGHGQGQGQQREQSGSEDQVNPDHMPATQAPSEDIQSGTAGVWPQHMPPAVLNYRRAPKALPLPASVAPLVPLLLNLSGDDRNLLLKVIKHKDFSPQLVPWTSSDQLHAFLDKNSVRNAASVSVVTCEAEQTCFTLLTALQKWERIVVHEEVLPQADTPTQFYALVRKDNDLLLKELLDSPEVNM